MKKCPDGDGNKRRPDRNQRHLNRKPFQGVAESIEAFAQHNHQIAVEKPVGRSEGQGFKIFLVRIGQESLQIMAKKYKRNNQRNERDAQQHQPAVVECEVGNVRF
jgi:hypothetical protein